jgi:DNA-binding response OmpR family regulator
MPVAVAKGGRVLVIDDERMLRDTLAHVLTEEGYVVDAAVDGEEALERVHANRPDAILLDLMMPGMNGRQFLQALRNDAAYAEVPVLIMTAVHGLEVNLASIGASAVVEKPFDPDDLLNKVALAVYRSREADPSAHAASAAAPIEPAPEAADRGVVLLVEHDRERLQRLDLQLSERGYAVVSTTRALAQLVRLARALQPRAILLELTTDGVPEVMRELRHGGELASIPLLAFAREPLEPGEHAPDGALVPASDAELVGFVERQRG